MTDPFFRTVLISNLKSVVKLGNLIRGEGSRSCLGPRQLAVRLGAIMFCRISIRVSSGDSFAEVVSGLIIVGLIVGTR